MKDRLLPRFLVVDDETSVGEAARRVLSRQGYQVKVATTGPEALALLEAEPFDVLFTDLRMPEMDGMHLLAQISRRFPAVVPVVITGYSSIPSAVETMRLGAYDYLPKPFTPEELTAAARKALERRQALSGPSPSEEDAALLPVGGIVAGSPAIREVLRMAEKVAPLRSTVLILGEEGTGKETIARAIHLRSPWGDGPFKAIDCRNSSQELLESELFGQDEGRLLGGGGTAFLDEICSLGPDLQGRLLRHIHERDTAGATPDPALPRLVFASGRDLGRAVEQGLFRKDLYYHLYVFPILMPPLRERLSEVPVLARHFLRQYAERTGTQPKKVSQEAMDLLSHYDWPGNIRQMRGAVEWAAAICGDDPIEPWHLPVGTPSPQSLSLDSFPPPRNNQELVESRRRLREAAVAKLEREFVLATLDKASWNKSEAARQVGMQRQNFQALMRKHAIRSRGEEE